MMTLIKISVKVRAPLSQVWRSWTSAHHIVHWNFASDTWHCPKADLELKEGGKFNYLMAAKDGSTSFDFQGTFVEIKEMNLLAYRLDDGRKVTVRFEQINDEVLVTEEFEAEESNSSDLQKKGWQAILDNFKSYTEDLNSIEKLTFEVTISAPLEVVYDTMIAPDTYQKWTAAFHPSSFYRGEWKEGEKILFLGLDAEGNEGGMISRIKKLVPHKIITIEHLGLYDKGQELYEGPEVMGWAGAIEEYQFTEEGGKTIVKVYTDTNKEFKDHMNEAWPKGLEILKSICEQ
ncbi:MAG TPA: SRPBCC family protein [Anditalea sp.]|nr:SRPBCC family protein [Anditalea sp.]